MIFDFGLINDLRSDGEIKRRQMEWSIMVDPIARTYRGSAILAAIIIPCF